MRKFTPYKNYFYNTFIALSSLTVCSTGIEQSAPGFIHGPEYRSFYTLHYCIKGKGTLKMNGLKWDICPGMVFLIYPNVNVQPVADNHDPWELSFIGFTGNDARLLTDACGFSPLSPVMVPWDGDTTNTMMLEVYDHRGDSPAAIVSMTAHLYSLLAHLIATAERSFIQNPGHQHIGPACAYIDDNYQKNITIEDIANAVGISRSSLYRAFMANLSVSPSDYLNKHRVNVSMTLLQKANLSLKEVAFLCGFSNSLYYSNVFKKFIGMSPTAYRKLQTRA